MDLKSLYWHFPYCIKKCNYCDFYRQVNPYGNFEIYQELLDRSQIKHDMLLSQNEFSINRLETLYLGGGTPSLWGVSGIDYLEKYFCKHKISFDQNYEFTLEINPGTRVLDELLLWKDLGVNRYSVGVQSLNPFFIGLLERIHSKEDSLKLIEKLRSEGQNYSVDFILGLPFSREHRRDICFELSEIMKFSPDHISMYILNVDNKYQHFKSLPDEDFIANEYLVASEFLSSNGFIHYEISNWAKKDFFSKHNLNYWRLGNWGALGPSSAGNLLNTEKKSGIRYTWEKQNADYFLEHLDHQKLKLEKLFMGLRTYEGIKLADIFSEEEMQIMQEMIARWEQEGYARKKSGVLVLCERGFLILNSLLDEVFSKIKTF